MPIAAGTAPASRYAPWLWMLTFLFCLRIAGQLATLFLDVPGLPPFEDWHGGVLPYEALLVAQLLLLVVLVRTALAFSTGNVVPAHGLGVVLLLSGAAYFGLMCARLVLGMTILDDHQWFTSRIPILFHLVLATYVLLVGKFHATRIKECSPCTRLSTD